MEKNNIQIKTFFAKAIKSHQSGDLLTAKSYYQKILFLDSKHFDCLYLLSSIAINEKKIAEAKNLLAKAIAVKPKHADAMFNLAVLIEQDEDFLKALEIYDNVIKISPKHLKAIFNRCIILAKLDRFDESLIELDQYDLINPNFSKSQELRKKILEKVNLLKKDNLFKNYCKEGAANLGRKEYLISLENLDNALKIYPNSPECHHTKGMVYEKLGQFDKAKRSYEIAIRLKIDSAETFNNLGNVLRELGDYENSIKKFETALKIKPNYPDALNNLGWTFYEQKKFKEAIKCYEEALLLRPKFTAAKFNLSYCNLMLGDYINGWKNYEYRKYLNISPTVKYNGVYWDGTQTLTNKTIFIYSEQGLGDTIQFCRYIEMLTKLGPRIFFKPQPQLLSLFNDFEGIDRIISNDNESIDYDYHCSLMSLPLAFGTTLNSIPNKIPYIFVNKSKNDLWHDYLKKFKGPKIGLVWSGGFRPNQPELWSVNKRRNLTFEQISFLNVDKYNFFSLQKGQPAESELLSLGTRFWKSSNFHNFTHKLNDFTDTAALINNLDLIISVDTSTAHLAAALGKPTWILNRFDNCWRWLAEGDSSSWYPSVKIFRQSKHNDWDSVTYKVRGKLLEFFN